MGDIVPDGDPYEPPLSAAIPGYEKEGATTGEAIELLLETLSPAHTSRYFQRQQAGEQEGILPRLIIGGLFSNQDTTQEPKLDPDEANKHRAGGRQTVRSARDGPAGERPRPTSPTRSPATISSTDGRMPRPGR